MSLLPALMQAPIGSAAGVDLCVAVCEAGGMGSLGLTWRTPTSAFEVVRDCRARTSGLFAANFVLHFEPRCLGAALDAGVPVVTFSWGDPSAYVADARRAGALVGIQVTSGSSALEMMKLAPDFLIVQGVEAGGHVQGHWALEHALGEVLPAAGGIPVYAAGGLCSGADLAWVMELGAAGGVFGTRFVASAESEAHSGYKELLVSSSETVLTGCFDGDWAYAAHRVLVNSTFLRWDAAGCPARGRRPGEGDVVGRTGSGAEVRRYDDTMPRVDTGGDWEAMALYAGTGVSGIRSVLPAGEIVRGILAEAGL